MVYHDNHDIRYIVPSLLGFVSYFLSLCLNSSQTTKKYFYNSYSIYMPNFNSLFEVVYPVAMTDFWPYFVQLINHNSSMDSNQC